MIGGVATAILNPVLKQAPLFRVAGPQSRLGTVHSWVAVVAVDLGRRIRRRRLAPPRVVGAGRQLWICEQMATPLHVDALVPEATTAHTAGSPPTTPSASTLDRHAGMSSGNHPCLAVCSRSPWPVS